MHIKYIPKINQIQGHKISFIKPKRTDVIQNMLYNPCEIGVNNRKLSKENLKNLGIK